MGAAYCDRDAPWRWWLVHFSLFLLVCLAAGLVAVEWILRQHGGTGLLEGLRFLHGRNGDGQLVVMDTTQPRPMVEALRNRLHLMAHDDDLTLNPNRCKARGTRRILMAGDSNMRKRFLGIARRLGVYVSEDHITGRGSKPFADHRHAVHFDGVSIEYAFWTPKVSTPSLVEPALPVWAGSETVADLAESVVVANYGLWAGNIERTNVSTIYCEALGAWKEQGAI